MAEKGLGNFTAPLVATLAATLAAGLATGNLAIKSLKDKLAALERRIESLQTLQVSGSSLDSILIKLEKRIGSIEEGIGSIEERMGSIEKKVSQVDDLARKIVQMTGILNILAEKVGLTEQSK